MQPLRAPDSTVGASFSEVKKKGPPKIVRFPEWEYLVILPVSLVIERFVQRYTSLMQD